MRDYAQVPGVSDGIGKIFLQTVLTCSQRLERHPLRMGRSDILPTGEAGREHA